MTTCIFKLDLILDPTHFPASLVREHPLLFLILGVCAINSGYALAAATNILCHDVELWSTRVVSPEELLH